MRSWGFRLPETTWDRAKPLAPYFYRGSSRSCFSRVLTMSPTSRAYLRWASTPEQFQKVASSASQSSHDLWAKTVNELDDWMACWAVQKVSARLREVIGRVSGAVEVLSSAAISLHNTFVANYLRIAKCLGEGPLGVKDANERVAQSSQASREIAMDIGSVDHAASEVSLAVSRFGRAQRRYLASHTNLR